MKVSVCIATYNGGQFITKQLKSVLSQLGMEDEVIISDDSSTDNTIEQIEQFADIRIKIYPNQKFKNPALNFGNAISKATGDYIFLCDQDDYWKPNKVFVMMKLLKTSDLVVSDCEVVDINGNIIHKSMFSFLNSGPGFIKNTIKNTFLGCCMAFNASYVKYILPIPREIKFEHDWLIGLIIQAKGKVCFTDESLMFYVRHGNNASLASSNKTFSINRKIKNRFYILSKVLSSLFKN